MKILALVSDAFGGRGGIAKFNRDLLAALCLMPEIQRVVALPRVISEPPDQLPDKLDYITCAADGKLRYGLAVLHSAIRNPHSALILCGHIHLLPFAFLARALCRGSSSRCPVVLIVHGIEAWQPTRRRLVNRLARRIDALIAVTDFTRRHFLAWAKPERAQTFLLPNCVDLSRFTPGPKNPALLERYGLRDRAVLLTVARLSTSERYKGIDEVLTVLPSLARDIPSLAYLIVGDGDDRARLQARARQLGVADRVVFTGWVNDTELVEHYRLGDAFVMPGSGEGFGIVYLEALACGVPVVASRADASAEVVNGCERAVAVNPDSREEIEFAIHTALRMDRGRRPVWVESFSEREFQRRCDEVLPELLKGRQGAVLAPAGSSRRRSILVFRIGQLGDTLVALPAMRAVREQFPAARLTLLCDRHPDRGLVLAADLLRGTELFDEFISYVVADSAGWRLARPFRMLNLLLRLRRGRFDTLVYLAPSTRTSKQVERDRRFFAAAGIRSFIGMSGFPVLPRKRPGEPLGATAREADLLLARLAADGVMAPPLGRRSFDLRLGAAEAAEVAIWLASECSDAGRTWLGVGPGSKMPAKRWPEERFRDVVGRLVAEFAVWPVVFGGAEDREVGLRLVRAWGCGYNGAGALSVRGSAAALRRCALYVGNDTGTMHLAAAVGVPCVAIFSAREWPGMWFPYGVEHKVFRSAVDCEGCGLVECLERNSECLIRIEPTEVLHACRAILTRHARSTQAPAVPN